MTTEDSVLKVAAAAQKIVTILNPLSAEGRNKAIASALAIFGDIQQPTRSPNDLSEKSNPQEPQVDGNGICSKAAAWMKKNEITREQLEHVFSIENESIDIIADKMPAKERKEQVLQVYALCGVATFVRTGELGFPDESARQLCVKIGCYSAKDHAAACKSFRNFITGSKAAGWKITLPGLSEGAKVIKLLIPQASA